MATRVKRKYTRSKPIAERFFEKVHRDGPLPLEAVENEEVEGVCWDFFGTGFSMGWGRTMQAHRASWILHKGPIPDGLQIEHRCNNHWCVNPEHLEPTTQSVNTKRDVDRRERLNARLKVWREQVATGKKPTAVHTRGGTAFVTLQKRRPLLVSPVETVEVDPPPYFGARDLRLRAEVGFLSDLERQFTPHEAYAVTLANPRPATMLARDEIHFWAPRPWSQHQHLMSLVTIRGVRCWTGLLFDEDGPYLFVGPYPGTLDM